MRGLLTTVEGGVVAVHNGELVGQNEDLDVLGSVGDDGVGYWRERIFCPYDRHETVYSGPSYWIGFGCTPESEIARSWPTAVGP